MTGTFINVTAIIVGGLLGIFFGARLSDNLKNTVVAGMGLPTTAIGFEMFLKTENPLVVLGALIVGGLLGEWWEIENRLQLLGIWLEKWVRVVPKEVPAVLCAVFSAHHCCIALARWRFLARLATGCAAIISHCPLNPFWMASFP